jgi:hypothetical protein
MTDMTTQCDTAPVLVTKVGAGQRAALRLLGIGVAIAVSGSAPASEGVHGFVMPPVLQLQAANGLTSDDILRIFGRDNLMLSDTEAAQIEAALRSAEAAANGADTAADATSDSLAQLRGLRLDALLYFSPSSWSLWLNGALVTPASVPPDIRINAITPDYVEIIWWPDSANPEARRIFTLRPNQIYLADSDTVMDVAELAQTKPEILPAAVELPVIAPQAPADDEPARPEELTLTRQQADQLRDLENALRSQD